MVLDGVSKTSLFSGILTAIAFLFQIIGFAAPYWITFDADNHSGLWYSCVKVTIFGTTVDQCGSHDGELIAGSLISHLK